MGRAIVLGNSVNTDQIISGEHVRKDDYDKFLFAKFRPDINQLVRTGQIAGSIIMAGRNFGSGSSRERAAIGLKKVGVEAVAAVSFNPIWERNATNCGLRIYRFTPGKSPKIADGDELQVDPDQTHLLDHTSGTSFLLMQTPELFSEIWRDGGLVGFTRKRYSGKQ
jgi:3-isopropylmalate/(R)-2-methylmalate dehydratase small subunit